MGKAEELFIHVLLDVNFTVDHFSISYFRRVGFGDQALCGCSQVPCWMALQLVQSLQQLVINLVQLTQDLLMVNTDVTTYPKWIIYVSS